MIKKYFFIVFFAFCFFVATLAKSADSWILSVENKTSINNGNTVEVLSGENQLADSPFGKVLTFERNKEVAVFSSNNILDNTEGAIEFYFCPNIPEQQIQRSNYLFSSEPYIIGYNTSPDGSAVYFLTKSLSNNPAGVYKKHVLEDKKWYKISARWTANAVSLFIDDKLLDSSGRGGRDFAETFRFGDSGWGFCDAQIREIKIYKGKVIATQAEPKGKIFPIHTISAPVNESLTPVFASIAGASNILQNNHFAELDSLSAEESKVFEAKKIDFPTLKALPANWHLNAWGSAPYVSGKVQINELAFSDGSKGHSLCWEQPNNKWGQSEFVCKQKFLPELFSPDNNYHVGFWAKGNGTLTIRLQEMASNKAIFSHTYKFLITSDWKFYRAPDAITIKNTNCEEVALQFAVYNNVEITMLEVAPLPAIDRAAELTFYVPFDNGNAELFFSTGSVAALGIGDEAPAVEGVDGKNDSALRIDRKRRITGNGFLRVPNAITYEGTENILDQNCGTIEFWLRPLLEMQEKQRWRNFTVFTCGANSYRFKGGSAPLEILIEENSEGALVLVFKERVATKEWPSRKTQVKEENIKTYKYLLPAKDEFINKWQHLALTYDEKSRNIFLNGEKIISVEALKSPAIPMNDSLCFATGHVSSPFLISADVDELKVYRGVRYHSNFRPSKEALDFQKIISADKGEFSKSKLLVEDPILSSCKSKITVPVRYGNENYQLNLSFTDGYPLIFSSKNAAMDIIAEHHPDLPSLEMESDKLDPFEISGRITKRQTAYKWQLENKADCLVLTLDLEKETSDWTAYLQGNIRLQNLSSKPWHKNFDGILTRGILSPFRAFQFDSQMLGLPITAAWNKSTGMCLALHPDIINSYIARGMNENNSLELAVRTVLDNGDKMHFVFELFPFNAKYEENGAVDIYHQRHPQVFALDEKINPCLYNGSAVTGPWDTPAYRERKDEFSLQEINRRARCLWTWVYKSGISTGNWAPDVEMLQELAPLNKYEVANAQYHNDIVENKTRGYAAASRRGIVPAPYISGWTEKRFTRYFSDSLYDDTDLALGMDVVHGYWWPPISDYPVIQSGTSYGVWLRKQIKFMLETYTSLNAFSHDELVGDYRFRKHTNLGGVRAFDEKGQYVHNMAAMGLFCNDVINMPNASGYKTAIVSNARIQSSGYNAMFRTTNNIFERQMHQAMQDWTSLRLHTRIMGEKPSSFWGDFSPIVGNYFYPATEDPRMLRYLFTLYQHQQIMLGMLFNVNMHYNVLGVKETVELLDELKRIHSLGYRHVAAVEKEAPGILSVRYGKSWRGAIVQVNASFEDRSGECVIDNAYLENTPLMAVEGEKLKVRNMAVNGSVKAHSWRAIEMLASVKGTHIVNYQSELKSSVDKRDVIFEFEAKAAFENLSIGLAPYEKISLLSLNGKNLDFTFDAEENKVHLENLTVSSGDILKLQFSDLRWQSPAEEIISAPYLDKQGFAIVYRGEKAQAEALRLQEYFRFWTLHQENSKVFEAPLFADLPENPSAYSLIVLFEEGDSGISMTDNIIKISGKGNNLFAMSEEYLKALDSKYIYLGVFGEQMPVRFWDYASTKEQKDLLAAAGVIKQLISVKEALPAFIDWLQETGTDLHDGF